MWEYESTPGALTVAPATWPADSGIKPSEGLSTLLVFAHPRCPCTRASIGELSRIMTRCYGQLDVQVWFFTPEGAAADWATTDLWHAARKIPGVCVARDPGGLEAEKFHALTSGHSMLYDATGHLLFSGGITASRGHAGDNLGKSSIEALVLGESAYQEKTLVFGCPLNGHEAKDGSEI
ncbi:MAG: hypothetical protein H6823_20035 [Planctomycetaceae bacterium]|nr:hypothetical protein [Planctomycetaceae bacterium]